jgi:ubiquitin C-terminal hydrolase
VAVLKELWSPGGGEDAVVPQAFMECAREHMPQFSAYHQHDSAEFFSGLLSLLHEDLICSHNNSIVADLYCSQLRSELKCPKPGCSRHASVKLDPCWLLQLPIPEVSCQGGDGDSTVTLEDCLLKYIESEALGADDTWECPGCKEHVRASKSIAPHMLPKVLVLHLVRARKASPPATAAPPSKIEALVKFPIAGLSMESYMSEGSPHKADGGLYDLFATTNHHGKSGEGHCTCTAQHALGREWCCFDDSSCRTVDSSSVVSSTADVLFYRRR